MRLSAWGWKETVLPLYSVVFFKVKEEAAFIGVKLFSNSLCFFLSPPPLLAKASAVTAKSSKPTAVRRRARGKVGVLREAIMSKDKIKILVYFNLIPGIYQLF